MNLRTATHTGKVLAATSLLLAIYSPDQGIAGERRSAYVAMTDARCVSAIHRVHSDVENRLQGNIDDVTLYAPREESPAAVSPVPSRQMRIQFELKTQWSRGLPANKEAHDANIALTNSPMLVKKYAQQIIADCSDVGSVVFYMWEWGTGWSVSADSGLVQDRCVYPSNGYRSLVWGEMGCA